jgi:folylpolyglutamate synthase/dihydropteroate synthase
VVVDGAHNVAGMTVLARTLIEEFTVEGEAVAVVGMLRGRDPVAMLEALQTAGVRSVVACAPDSPRALPVEIVAEAALGLGMEVRAAPTVAEAVTAAVDGAGPDDRCIICGSLYVVADARRRLVGDGL